MRVYKKLIKTYLYFNFHCFLLFHFYYLNLNLIIGNFLCITSEKLFNFHFKIIEQNEKKYCSK